MKTIKDAVIELKGVWPKEESDSCFGVPVLCECIQQTNIRAVGDIVCCGESFRTEFFVRICNQQEFKSEAKRMGYIKGYRWGKEYCANGETPDLPDDVVYQVRGGYEHFQGWQERKSIKKTLWGKTTYFRIIDERYRPTEEKEKSPLGQYEWGKEYPTNGKRPDLADDVEICVILSDSSINGLKISNLDWSDKFLFKITDPRYKPADTSYLNAPTQAQRLTHSEEVKSVSWVKCPICGESGMRCETLEDDLSLISCVNHGCESNKTGENAKKLTNSEKPESNWHERGELPPVGETVYITGNGDYEKVVIVAHDNGVAVVRYPEGEKYWGVNACYLRPLSFDVEKIKVIDAALKVNAQTFKENPRDMEVAVVRKLYDAGMLVLPPNKSDTKD